MKAAGERPIAARYTTPRAAREASPMPRVQRHTGAGCVGIVQSGRPLAEMGVGVGAPGPPAGGRTGGLGGGTTASGTWRWWGKARSWVYIGSSQMAPCGSCDVGPGQWKRQFDVGIRDCSGGPDAASVSGRYWDDKDRLKMLRLRHA